jgi:TolB protein
MNPDGSGVSPFIVFQLYADNPSWSPDGKFIVYENAPTRNAQNYVVHQVFKTNIERTQGSELTSTATNDGSPSLSPDGSRIAFGSNRNSTGFWDQGLFVMNSDGTGVTPLNTGFTSVSGIDWGK